MPLSASHSQIVAEFGQRPTQPQGKNIMYGRSHSKTIHRTMNAVKYHVLHLKPVETQVTKTVLRSRYQLICSLDLYFHQQSLWTKKRIEKSGGAADDGW